MTTTRTIIKWDPWDPDGGISLTQDGKQIVLEAGEVRRLMEALSHSRPEILTTSPAKARWAHPVAPRPPAVL
jgi:hypothetical protein